MVGDTHPTRAGRELAAVSRGSLVVRANVQRVNGRTDREVWSKRYRGAMHDMHRFREEVTTAGLHGVLALVLEGALSLQAARVQGEVDDSSEAVSMRA